MYPNWQWARMYLFISSRYTIMPRAKIWGYVSVIVSLFLGYLFLHAVFIKGQRYPGPVNLNTLDPASYYGLSVPIVLVAGVVLATGFWIGWTILTIKVVPPMPEIVEKKDYSKIKALFLCIVTVALGAFLAYGVYLRSFWALAVPATVISVVIIGAIFWVGIAIITTRSSLPKDSK